MRTRTPPFTPTCILLLCACFVGFSHLTYGQGAPPANPQASDWVVRSFEPTAARLIYTSARAMGMLRGVGEYDVWSSLRYDAWLLPRDAGFARSRTVVESSHPQQ